MTDTQTIADQLIEPATTRDGDGGDPSAKAIVTDTATDQLTDPTSIASGLLSSDGALSITPPADDADANAMSIPQTPDGYQITIDPALGEIDPALHQRLHEAGFNNAQAQLVYDLAGEVLSPMMAEIDQVAQRASDRAALIAEFGGVENWQKLAPKIERWGRANLPETAFDAMCQTKDGVKALHRLMSLGQETTLGRSDGGDASGDIRAEIRRKMNDPRYWRDRDPGLVADVQAGFAKLRGA